MKKIIISSLVVMFVFGMFSFVSLAEASVRVRGYYKPSSGTYVAPSYRSSPNKVKYDNYSSKGNYNPYSGKRGYKGW